MTELMRTEGLLPGTVNKVAYRKHHFTTSGVCGTESTESTTSCQYMENNTHLLPQKQG